MGVVERRANPVEARRANRQRPRSIHPEEASRRAAVAVAEQNPPRTVRLQRSKLAMKTIVQPHASAWGYFRARITPKLTRLRKK
jgi:hypothetical protein